MREITDSRARTREELEGLYRKIVSCVLLRSVDSLFVIFWVLPFFLTDHHGIEPELENVRQCVIAVIFTWYNEFYDYNDFKNCLISDNFRSGLGSPTDISVVREATAALQSVFPQTELGTFMSLTKRDKVFHSTAGHVGSWERGDFSGLTL